MKVGGLLVAALVLVAPVPAIAQDREQTLADIRQELNVLYVEMQKLKREMSTTGAPSATVTGSSVLERVASMEAELQRLTSHTEELTNRVNRIVADGTNRIGDLEFRLVELEGGDLSKLGETTTLGGPTETVQPSAVTPPPASDGVLTTELAVSERTDFENASKALDEGDFQKAAQLFAGFNQTYPGSPLAAQAELKRGKALDGVGDTREAARAYLASFSADSAGPVAPSALFELGAALGRLQQTEQACITLGEVGTRFPGDPAVASAQSEMAKLGCS
ncbi:MAG: tol-pal system protein YbgF [Heliomarina sp.]|uniref:tol-pal system protein YbgF n=1 Tax=Heliomarina sp. TaxID=2917556 RepID=UPI0040596EA1